MAVSVSATCSECYTVQEVEVGPGIEEIRCSNCGHSVPSLETREVAVIHQVKAQERWKTLLTIALMGGAAFLLFLHLVTNIRSIKTELTHEGKVTHGWITRRSNTEINFAGEEGGEDSTYDLDEVSLVTMPQGEPFQLFFYLSMLVGVAGVAAAALASGQRVVVEF